MAKNWGGKCPSAHPTPTALLRLQQKNLPEFISATPFSKDDSNLFALH
jgi:hypothetical protein